MCESLGEAGGPQRRRRCLGSRPGSVRPHVAPVLGSGSREVAASYGCAMLPGCPASRDPESGVWVTPPWRCPHGQRQASLWDAQLRGAGARLRGPWWPLGPTTLPAGTRVPSGLRLPNGPEPGCPAHSAPVGTPMAPGSPETVGWGVGGDGGDRPGDTGTGPRVARAEWVERGSPPRASGPVGALTARR